MNIIIDNYDFWNMAAEKYWNPTKGANLKEITHNAIYSGAYCLSEKIDGDWRMLIKDMNGEFHLRGRSESVNGGYADKIDWVPHIKEALSFLPNGTVLLGEVYLDGKRGSRHVTTIMGCLADKAVARQEKDEKLSYYIFDVLAYNGHNLIDLALQHRLQYFNYINNSKYIRKSEYYFNPTEMEEVIAKILEADGEGVVLKRLDGKYEPGKRPARKSIKIKKEIANSIDCFITGAYKEATFIYNGDYIQDWVYWYNEKTCEKVNENRYDDYKAGEPWKPITKGAYYGWAGAIELGIYRNNEIIPIAWISNITEEVKRGIVEDLDSWIFKVCEVQAMMIEKDSKKLRHGKIMNWRPDKNWRDCDGNELFNDLK